MLDHRQRVDALQSAAAGNAKAPRVNAATSKRSSLRILFIVYPPEIDPRKAVRGESLGLSAEHLFYAAERLYHGFRHFQR